MQTEGMQTEIAGLFDQKPSSYTELHFTLFQRFKNALNAGQVRAAEPDASARTGWRVNAWVKKGILLGFRMGAVVDMSVDPVRQPAQRLAIFLGGGAEEVEKILLKAESGNPTLLMSVVNWGEIYYSILRGASQELADSKSHEIAGMQIEIVPVDARDLELVRQAAVFKAAKKMSYADCFAAALAKIKNAELVTGDPEFKVVESELKKIRWLR